MIRGVTLTFAAVLFMVLNHVGCGPSQDTHEHSTKYVPVSPTLSEEVENVLAKKNQLVEKLLRDSVISQAVRESNLKHQNTTAAEIQELDRRWRASDGIDEFIKSFMTNPCASSLMQFQEDHDGFVEIFVTNEKGLNVCQTNKTSDFYQADEDWWVQAYQHGVGKSYHGSIEFDESSRAEAISLYLPIMDLTSAHAIGVCKAVIDITVIKEEL